MASNASRPSPRAGDRCGPVVGLSTYCEPARWGVWDTEAALLPRAYLDGVAASGGAPVLLPPVGDPVAALSAVDALVLTGGADVDPGRYRQRPHERTGRPQERRDGYEWGLLHAALDAGVPVLGVCRGLEVLNVALGGTLAQHLPDVLGTDDHQPAPGVFGTVTVHTEPGTRAAAILGPETKVRCHHHQGVGELAADLAATAWAADGTVEAAERPGGGFVLAVQWHPEENPGDTRLFRALVAAAGEHRNARRSA